MRKKLRHRKLSLSPTLVYENLIFTQEYGDHYQNGRRLLLDGDHYGDLAQRSLSKRYLSLKQKIKRKLI